MSLFISLRRHPFLIAGGIVVILAIGAGIWASSWFYNSPYDASPNKGDSSSLLISKITVGAALSADEAQRKDPRFSVRDTYTISDKLVLDVETTKNVTTPLSLSVRLVTEEGTFKQLSPSTLTIQPGKTTFCCWQIPERGKYRLQIFRPEGTVTSIPLSITQL